MKDAELLEKFKDQIDWAKGQLQTQENILVSKELHGDRSNVFKLATPSRTYFLKIGNDLKKEHTRLLWLSGKLPVPEVIAFKATNEYEALLISGVKGKNLKLLSKEWQPEKVVNALVTVVKRIHLTNIENCPFGIVERDSVLIHGDASLPNFIFDGDMFSGYIDLGDVTIGDKETDFAAAIWSLQYNLGKGYGKMFLEKYGLTDVTEEMVENLRLKYEDMQEAWGL